MPKISNKDISIYHKDIRKNFKITVMYNQEHSFYAEIPKVFFDTVHHLSDEVKKQYHITRKNKTKYSRSVNDPYEQLITAATESDCLSRMKTCLDFLVDKTIQQRNVIIVFYNPKSTVRYNEHLHNQEHPQIGLEFGLTYAVETSVDDKKVYSIYNEHEAFGEKRVSRTELSLWNQASIIIPDTPENRQTLESLYGALVILNNKMKAFTETPEKLLEFIASKTKLLG